METTLSEVVRILLSAAFIAGFIWTLSVMYRYYQAGDQPIRLLRMMRRLGISPTTAAELQFARYLPIAIRLCYHCASKAECDAWFAKHEKSYAPPEFCANGGFLHMAMNEERHYAAKAR